MAKLSEETIDKILEVVKKNRQDADRVEFAGRKWFERHCRQRLAKVSIFGRSRPNEPLREFSEKRAHVVCVICLRHKMNGEDPVL